MTLKYHRASVSHHSVIVYINVLWKYHKTIMIWSDFVCSTSLTKSPVSLNISKTIKIYPNAHDSRIQIAIMVIYGCKQCLLYWLEKTITTVAVINEDKEREKGRVPQRQRERGRNRERWRREENKTIPTQQPYQCAIITILLLLLCKENKNKKKYKALKNSFTHTNRNRHIMPSVSECARSRYMNLSEWFIQQQQQQRLSKALIWQL